MHLVSLKKWHDEDMGFEVKAEKPSARRHKKNKKKKLAKFHREFEAAKVRAGHYLVGFWLGFNATNTKEERLTLLRRAANPCWPRVSTKVKGWCRRDKSMKMAILFSQFDECGCCAAAKAQEKHHIVPCSYGGPTIQENILVICQGCHDAIHPWLNEQNGGGVT